MHIPPLLKKIILLCLGLLFAKICFCQSANLYKNDRNIKTNISNEQLKFKESNLGVEVIASILPQAKITSQSDRYKLRSHLQSSYDIGINYLHYTKSNLIFSTGLHLIIGKRNFFANIPSEDINNWDGRNIIEDKELWGSIRVPFSVEKKLNAKKPGCIYVKAGFNFRYSGLMSDELNEQLLVYSNNQIVRIFNAEISARNNGIPWITFLAGVSKSFLLDNKNILSLTLQTDISPTYFLKSNYEITIPNQPVTTGTYKINGSSLGLSVQYIFTGTNKQLVNPKKRIKTPDLLAHDKLIKRETFFDKYVFKGNHVQFNFALLSTYKARLENISGNHSASANSAPGLLLSFKYQKNFNDEYSLISGPEATLAGRNFITSFSKNDFSPPLVSDYNTKGNSLIQDLILSLPVMLEKRRLYSKTKFLFADAGIRFNFSLGADLDVYSINLLNTSNGVYRVGGVNVYSNNDVNPWISFPINAGHSWLLKNNNLLQFAICSNFSFTKYVNGTYQVNIPGQPLTEGKYSSTGSYIGLSMNYVFTNANYRLRKANEK